MSDTFTELKSYLDRIMRLHEERKGLSDDIGEIYKEAKGRGFDRKAMVATVRRLLGDETAFAELDATVDLYLRAYRGIGTEHANAHVPAPAQPDYDRETGEITALSELVETITVLDRHGNEASATVADRDAETVPPAAGGSPALAAPVDEEADLYQRAVAIVVEGQKASTAYVQRLLGIGYNKAASLMERMEAEGIVSRSDVGGRRTVLIEQNAAAPESCGGVDGHAEMSTPIRSETDNASLVVEGAQGHDAAIVGVEPGPQDATPKPLPVQVHKAIGGEPLKPAIDYSDVDAVTRQRQADTPDIPSFLKRANTGQAGRA
jgi:uncharacterized protein (UPF0335 family)